VSVTDFLKNKNQKICKVFAKDCKEVSLGARWLIEKKLFSDPP
jgi:hypothetical protein